MRWAESNELSAQQLKDSDESDQKVGPWQRNSPAGNKSAGREVSLVGNPSDVYCPDHASVFDTRQESFPLPECMWIGGVCSRKSNGEI